MPLYIYTEESFPTLYICIYLQFTGIHLFLFYIRIKPGSLPALPGTLSRNVANGLLYLLDLTNECIKDNPR